MIKLFQFFLLLFLFKISLNVKGISSLGLRVIQGCLIAKLAEYLHEGLTSHNF